MESKQDGPQKQARSKPVDPSVEKQGEGQPPAPDANTQALAEQEIRLREEHQGEMARLRAELEFKHRHELKIASGVRAARPREQSLTSDGVKLRALSPGFYDQKRWRAGNVFIMAKVDVEQAIAAKRWPPQWAEEVDAATPLLQTSGKQELRRAHDEVLGEVMAKHSEAQESGPTGRADVLVTRD